MSTGTNPEELGLASKANQEKEEVMAKLGISFFENRTRSCQAVIMALANKAERSPKEENIYQQALSYLEFSIMGKPEEWMK
jgi:hypothetical protein